MSRRAFDYDREPFFDPKFSARTHDYLLEALQQERIQQGRSRTRRKM